VSGEPTVFLEGPAADGLVEGLAALAGLDVVLIGGLAVMARLGRVHRATRDVDALFDNPSDEPTTVRLVSAGIAIDDPAPQRVVIGRTVIDVIDTQPLPDDPHLLPDDPGSRLFVCAHRYAYESAALMRIVSATSETTARVATPPALIAMKAHALAFARRQRRSEKRSSDLADLYRLIASVDLAETAAALAAPSWGLGAQVRVALTADVGADPEMSIAALRRSDVAEIATIDADDFEATIAGLLTRLH
jgi:predicted nucleotidyltransferase